ncbi:hypothetical protein CFC21_010391 [Triticum aestivum]|uniref:DUF3741 domain-containing protein n=2 Tax=Triticum aestivum TaxID=4565 RepID=A0A9R1DKA5_WHEAT|nr:uncharacterized protein LOC123180270 isoform X1 [Triticum aestivum]KAF6993508.1 hypothetical protein CFC21_010391 [Triticum aestivum]
MAKLAQSSFALDLLRRLLCAHTAGNAAGGGNTNTVHADVAALRRGDGAAASKEEEGAMARSPCIVARLMGLDAMPTPPRDQQQTLRRSRSASSAEGWSSPTPCCFGDAPRRRVVRTTSASFRDRPTYLRRENDEFLLLSFSPDDDGGDDRDAAGWPRSDDDDAEMAGSRRGKRTVDGDGAKKQRRRRRRLPRRRRGDEDAESKPGRSRRPAAAAEECGLENSSPVSVLEAREAQEESSTATTASSSSVEELEHAEPCSPSSDGGETRLAPRQQLQRSRRKLLQANSDNLGDDPRPAAASSSSCVSKCSDRNRRDRRVVNNKAEAIAPDATGIWRIICRMVEQDICGIKWQARGGGDIAAAMGSEILDQLIWEQTAELMQLTVV